MQVTISPTTKPLSRNSRGSIKGDRIFADCRHSKSHKTHRIGKGAYATGQEPAPAEIQARSRLRARLPKHVGSADDRQNSDRQVDQKNRAPSKLEQNGLNEGSPRPRARSR